LAGKFVHGSPAFQIQPVLGDERAGRENRERWQNGVFIDENRDEVCYMRGAEKEREFTSLASLI